MSPTAGLLNGERQALALILAGPLPLDERHPLRLGVVGGDRGTRGNPRVGGECPERRLVDTRSYPAAVRLARMSFILR